MELKQILNKYFTGIGRYQMRILLLITIIRLPSAIHSIGYVFYAATPTHWCSHPKHHDHINLTKQEWKRFSIPAERKSGQVTYSKCQVYSWAKQGNVSARDVTETLREIDNGTTYGDDVKEKCNSWEYDSTTNVRSSLVTEWDMVCDNAWVKSVIASSFVVGWTIGAQVVGYSSDRWGRRLVLRILVVGAATFGIVLPFANNYIAFLVIRAIVAGCINPAASICYTFCLEIISDRWRSVIGNAFFIIWAVCYAALGGVAYLLRDRFIFMISVAAPTIIILIPVWFIPESISWLVAKGHQEEADRLIHKMARTDKKSIPAGLSVTVQQDKQKTETRILDLVRTPGLRKTTIIMSLNWIAQGLLYYAISWNASDYHGNLYLNVFLSGLVEIPAYLLNMVIISKLGRRWGMAGCTIVGGVSLLLSLLVPEEVTAGKVTLVMVAKFCITMSFTTAYQYSVEVYPTVIRSSGLLTCVTAARIGSLFAPFLPLIGGVWPDIICGTLALSAGLLLLLLPETLHMTLPGTVEEAEQRYNDYRLRDMCMCSRPDVKDPTELAEGVMFLNVKEKQ